MRLGDLAVRLGGQLEGSPDLEVSGVAPLESAGPGQLSFLVDKRQAAGVASSRAGCVLVGKNYAGTPGKPVIRVPDPRLAFARAVSLLQPRRRPAPGIHPTAVIDPSAKVGPGASIGPYCVIGPESKLGRDCVLHPHVTIYDEVTLGDRVEIHAGTVIGADGFGFVPTPNGYEKFPQVGTVEIGDDVEIGANCTIDRGALGPTRIGAGTKIDNLVHIAHNCVLGRNVAIAGQAGMAGGVTVGDWAVIAGQSGISDKAQLEPRAIVGAKSMIAPSKKVCAGEPVFGIPARPLREHLKMMANLGYVGELRQQVKELRKHLGLADTDTEPPAEGRPGD